MRILAALVLGYFLVVGRVAGFGAGVHEAPLRAGMTKVAENEIDRAMALSLTERVHYDVALDEPKRSVIVNRVVSLPWGCRSVGRPYDLLVHFHGAPGTLEPAFERSGIQGALVVFNLGNGSGAYEAPYEDPSAYSRMLVSVTTAVRELCPRAAAPKRVALSGWSAGYGAIMRIIDRVNDAARIDAVLLVDGLHVGFEPTGYRVVNAVAMAPFTLFADEAVRGEKLFAISHSTIPTPYASTTETAQFLIDTEGLTVDDQKVPGPLPGMVQTSRADAESFHVRGFAGEDKEAHCDQLFAFGDLLLPMLRERWEKP